MSKHFPSGFVTLSESGVTPQRAFRSLLVCNNMRISHINNTSKMFTMADIDFVQYILWCCPAVTVVQHHRGNKCVIQLYRGGEGYAGSSSLYFVVLLGGSIT